MEVVRQINKCDDRLSPGCAPCETERGMNVTSTAWRGSCSPNES